MGGLSDFEYVCLSTEFRIASAALTISAMKETIAAAMLAYRKLTLRCVECHKHVFSIRMTEAYLGKPGVFVALYRGVTSTQAIRIE